MANDINPIIKGISGVCVVVVAGMILWLCSSTYTAAVRLSVLETQFNVIQVVLTDLKFESKANRTLLMDIRNDQKSADKSK